MKKGSLVHAHGLTMIRYIEKLTRLGFVIDHELSVDLLDAELPEPAIMLVTAEKSLKKEKVSVFLVQSSKSKKKPKKKQNKKKENTTLKPTGGINKYKGTCHHCGIEEYWRINCKEYLATVEARKLSEASTLGIFMIEINLSTINSCSWVFDTEYTFHICNNMQEIKSSRKLRKGEMDL
uniref:Uncharacterized protein n=1 Tax=Manihot esculenta TaxID=3983 RepID=A0A2C9VZW0_MANES